MISDTDLPYQPDALQQRPTRSFKPLKLFAFLVVALFIVLVTGTSGYLLGIRTGQKSEIISQTAPLATTTLTTTVTATPTVSLTTVPVLPTEIPTLTANWKTYINAQWGLSFKYPETWFPQEVPGWNPPGEAINFYPNGVTPDPGEADRPTNAVLNVELSSFNQQTNEQFISMASQTAGYQKILNIAGKPAIKTQIGEFQQYYIKLSNTRKLILTTYNEDGNKKLNTIISSIKFASE